MIVLAVDTAGAACSAALWRDGAVLCGRVVPMARGQAEHLMPMVTGMAGEAGLRLADIDLFAVTIGPGAFTGLRIGIAACAGMALAADRPILGIGNLDAAMAAVPADRRAGRLLLVALDSRRAELFAQPFGSDGAPLSAPACVAPGDLAALVPDGPVLVTGDELLTPEEPLAPGRIRSSNDWTIGGQARDAHFHPDVPYAGSGTPTTHGWVGATMSL